MIPSEEKAKTINKWPMAVLVMIISSLLTIVADRLFFTEDSRNDDCKEQVVYLRGQLDDAHSTINEYVRTILFKDSQIKNRDLAIDSLKREREVIQ